MKLLLTNDDGIMASGIIILAKALEKEAEIVLAAPDIQRSASGHSITLDRGLTVKEVKIDGLKVKAYSVDGTPVDCVRVGIDKLFDRRPDMVISGINKGFNRGIDVLYSGTVSAAIESAISRIPAIAISAENSDSDETYHIAADYVKEIIKIVTSHKILPGTVFNVNVPKVPREKIKGIKVCSLGEQIYSADFTELDTDSYKSYIIGGKIIDPGPKGTDVHYLKEGYITLTPLHYDLTNYELLKDVNSWFK